MSGKKPGSPSSPGAAASSPSTTALQGGRGAALFHALMDQQHAKGRRNTGAGIHSAPATDPPQQQLQQQVSAVDLAASLVQGALATPVGATLGSLTPSASPFRVVLLPNVVVVLPAPSDSSQAAASPPSSIQQGVAAAHLATTSQAGIAAPISKHAA